MADHTQDSLLREIDEELRQERYAKLWKKYGNHLIAAALALVLSVAGYQGWRTYDVKNRMEQAERFSAAQKLAASGETAAAAEAFAALADDAGGGYELLASLRAAAARAETGDKPGAIALYRQLSGDSGYDPVYRDLAVVMEALLIIDDAEAEAIRSRLAPLMADDNPWRHSARELAAHAAMRGGDRKAARELFTKLAGDGAAPGGVRSRASEMLSVLGN